MKITHYIEKRRKEKKKTKEDLAKDLGISIQVYRRRMSGDGFTDSEILLASRILDFDLQAVPNENKF